MPDDQDAATAALLARFAALRSPPSTTLAQHTSSSTSLGPKDTLLEGARLAIDEEARKAELEDDELERIAEGRAAENDLTGHVNRADEGAKQSGQGLEGLEARVHGLRDTQANAARIPAHIVKGITDDDVSTTGQTEAKHMTARSAVALTSDRSKPTWLV
jgi:hypothetical protein